MDLREVLYLELARSEHGIDDPCTVLLGAGATNPTNNIISTVNHSDSQP
jgi:hypothetical protein